MWSLLKRLLARASFQPRYGSGQQPKSAWQWSGPADTTSGSELQQIDNRIRYGDWSGALDQLDRRLANNAHDAPAWISRSWIWLLRSDPIQAEADATRAIELGTGNVFAWVNRAIARRSNWHLSGAAEDLDTAARVDPGLPNIAIQRSSLSWANGDLHRARAELEPLRDKQESAGEYYYQLASLSTEQGQYRQALGESSQALLAQPGDRHTLLLRVGLFGRLGDFAAAREAAQHLRASGTGLLMHADAMTSCFQEDYESAVKALWPVREVGPDTWHDYMLLSWALAELGRFDEAAAIPLGQQTKPQEKALAQLTCADRLFSLDRTSQARELLQAARTYQPANPHADRLEADMLMVQGEPERAYQMLLPQFRKYPKLAILRADHAMACLASGRLDDAVQASSGMEQSSCAWVCALILAESHRRLGNTAKAERVAAESLRLVNDNTSRWATSRTRKLYSGLFCAVLAQCSGLETDRQGYLNAAFRDLRAGLAGPASHIRQVLATPVLDRLRSHDGFQALLK